MLLTVIFQYLVPMLMLLLTVPTTKNHSLSRNVVTLINSYVPFLLTVNVHMGKTVNMYMEQCVTFVDFLYSNQEMKTRMKNIQRLGLL